MSSTSAVGSSDLNTILNSLYSSSSKTKTSSSSNASGELSLLNYLDGSNSSDDESSSIISSSMTSMAGLINAIASLSGEQKSELKSLLEDAKSSIKDGSFDASELAGKASKSLLDALSGQGVDLEETLTAMNSLYEQLSSGKTSDYSSLLSGGSSNAKSAKLMEKLLAEALSGDESSEATAAG